MKTKIFLQVFPINTNEEWENLKNCINLRYQFGTAKLKMLKKSGITHMPLQNIPFSSFFTISTL